MTRHVNLALMGFGNVGKALARLLMRKREELQNNYGMVYSVTGIATGRHGITIDPEGLDLERALDENDLNALSALKDIDEPLGFIRRCQADVLFESTPVNYKTGQPATNYLRTALELGMHAITANKGPVVHAYHELGEIASAKGVKFYFESSVMDGAPVFSLFREALPAVQLKAFHGVLNSTTNMILTLMEEGQSFENAVKHCQAIGIAETDPSGDVDGWDAAIKVAALVSVLMGQPLKPDGVDRQGISEITTEDIDQARNMGKRWKLVCSARRRMDSVDARVSPELVGQDSPLYGISGTTSIVQFETDVLGLLSLVEADPGPNTTAYGMFADFLNAVRRD